MADEDDDGVAAWLALEEEFPWEVNALDTGEKTYLLPRDVNPMAYSKYPLERLMQAAYDGDLEVLERMLDREDPIDGYHHDINAHLTDINALHAAAMNGQLEAVEMLLKARADPHVRQSMPHGKHPKDGATAREMADKWGYDDVVAALQRAEERVPRGVYLRYGSGNNSKLHAIDRPEGLDPDQERRARERHKGMVRPLPSRDERKFYGELVFGLTHGWDERGEVIRRAPAHATGPMVAGPAAGSGAAPGPGPPAAPAERTAIGLLFPGQGSHYVGMLSTAAQPGRVREMLAAAQEILGFDLGKVCAEGPGELLEQPLYAYPAIYIASLAAAERLRAQRPEAVDRPGAVAGLELGEYSALTVAGVMDFTTGLRLVKARAEALAEASREPPQASLSVAGIELPRLELLCEEVRRTTGAVCQVANELFPKGAMCAGEAEAIERLRALAQEAGALQTKVMRTSGALHTPLMRAARPRLEAALREALPGLRAPRCDVYMNATGRAIPAGTPPAQIVPLLCDQLTSMVLWETSVKGMVAAGITEFYEVGPMKQLKAMMKRIDQDAFSRTEAIEA